MDENTITAQKAANESEDPVKYGSALSHTLLYVIMGSVVCVVGIIAALLCRAQMQDKEFDILHSHQSIEQSWIDATVETAHVWHRDLVEQVRYVSRAEMFCLFTKDYQEAMEKARATREEADLRSLRDESDYLRGLLQDTVARRGWKTARIISNQGQVLLSTDGDGKLDAELRAIVERMHKGTQTTAYSLPHMLADEIVFDVVDPLFEVMGSEKPTIVGFLHIVVGLDSVFANFLSDNRLQGTFYTPLLVAKGENKQILVQEDSGRVSLATVQLTLPKTMPFAKRSSLREDSEVWSLGQHLPFLPWYFCLECPDSVITQQINDEARETYSLGVLGSLAIALVLAIFVGTRIVRHKAQEEQRCIGGLVHAIECALDGADAKLRYLQGRSKMVEDLSLRVAKEMHLSAKSRETIQLAARLSQVGKIFVPRDIMIKRGLLTEDERRQVQLAPYHAFNVLKGVLPMRVARAIYQMGGKVIDDPKTGLNHELSMSEMLPEARVLLVANDFCAMVSQRGTRPPLPYAEARSKLSGRPIYDKDVVRAINAISDEEIRSLLNEHESDTKPA